MRNSEVSAHLHASLRLWRALPGPLRPSLEFAAPPGGSQAVSARTDSGGARCEKAAVKGVFDGLGNLRCGFVDNPGRGVA
ncbi:hypothetical protein Sgleb_54220 [Streptomyces glebosus]|uniref:Uncharacterized protein n=1 Tax=Streptomyces glebosus TaxID=249580 RepID=A0A640T6U4_9ACTN|nr:hypothetical protein Sgleb_54220 [Streptomyces glebosus]